MFWYKRNKIKDQGIISQFMSTHTLPNQKHLYTINMHGIYSGTHELAKVTSCISVVFDSGYFDAF